MCDCARPVRHFLFQNELQPTNCENRLLITRSTAEPQQTKKKEQKSTDYLYAGMSGTRRGTPSPLRTHLPKLPPTCWESLLIRHFFKWKIIHFYLLPHKNLGFQNTIPIKFNSYLKCNTEVPAILNKWLYKSLQSQAILMYQLSPPSKYYLIKPNKFYFLVMTLSHPPQTATPFNQIVSRH